MPWNNQGGGGGPWGQQPGSGGGSPWGGRGGGGGNTPDLDDLIRKGREQIGRYVPPEIGGWRGVAILVVLLLLGWASSGLYRVAPDELGVVQRFGAYVRTENPGLRYHLPFPIEAVSLPKVTTENRIEIGFRKEARGERDEAAESLMLTGDENIIDIDFVVNWRIDDAVKYLFRIRDPDDTVKRAAESVMREVIGRTQLQPAMTEDRARIEIEVREKLQQLLTLYDSGVRVTQVQLEQADPPGAVIGAFNDVQEARNNREQARSNAEAVRNRLIPEARGEAVRLEQEAEAYKEQVIAEATGNAARFVAIFEAYAQAKDVTRQRIYLETLEEILARTNKVVLDRPGSGGDVVPYLPLDQLLRQGTKPLEGRKP